MLVNGLDDRYNIFSNVSFYCFDIMQYRKDTNKVIYTVFANYMGKTYFSEIDVKCNIGCNWLNERWVVNCAWKNLVILGLENILINLKNKEKILFN